MFFLLKFEASELLEYKPRAFDFYLYGDLYVKMFFYT